MRNWYTNILFCNQSNIKCVGHLDGDYETMTKIDGSRGDGQMSNNADSASSDALWLNLLKEKQGKGSKERFSSTKNMLPYKVNHFSLMHERQGIGIEMVFV